MATDAIWASASRPKARALTASLRRSSSESLRRLPRSPDLNSFAERWVKSVKEECLSKLILFGEKSLRHALREYVVYYHHERNHQGKENLLLFPASDQLPQSERKVRSRERLGGMLRFYHREAA